MSSRERSHESLKNTGLDAVLFDFDDTLQKGERDEQQAQAILQRLRDRPDYSDMVKAKVEKYKKEYPETPTMSEDEFQRTIEKQFIDRHESHFQLVYNARELLSYVREQGYKVGLVTTRDSNSLQSLLSMHGIDKAFDVVVSREDCEQIKPHPQPLRLALERIGVDPKRAMYVGDNQATDIIAGSSIGMRTILVNPNTIDQYSVQPDYHVKELQGVLPILTYLLK